VHTLLSFDRPPWTHPRGARTTDRGAHQRYDYAAPAFEFGCRLVYDESGLVLSYPGIAVRAA
jgi:hypothetical protein